MSWCGDLELKLVTNISSVVSREELGEVQLLGLPLFLQQVDVLHHLHVRFRFVAHLQDLLLDHALQIVELLHSFEDEAVHVGRAGKVVLTGLSRVRQKLSPRA
jgi:hypothetical protein